MKNNFFDLRNNRRTLKTDYERCRYKKIDVLTIPQVGILQTDDNAIKLILSSPRSQVKANLTESRFQIPQDSKIDPGAIGWACHLKAALQQHNRNTSRPFLRSCDYRNQQDLVTSSTGKFTVSVDRSLGVDGSVFQMLNQRAQRYTFKHLDLSQKQPLVKQSKQCQKEKGNWSLASSAINSTNCTSGINTVRKSTGEFQKAVNSAGPNPFFYNATINNQDRTLYDRTFRGLKSY